MKSRLPLLLILLVVALVAAFFSPATRGFLRPNATTVQQRPAPSDERDASPFLDRDTTFAALRNRLLEGYRLRPDERYLGAVVEIARMSGRIATPTPDARFADGAWQVECGADTVATLSEFPSFAELESSLTRWARTCNEQSGGASAHASVAVTPTDSVAARAVPKAAARPGASAASTKTISGGADAAWQRPLAGLDPISALRVIDERWNSGDHGAALLLGATRALTLLTMQSPDLVGTATPIASRALASLAMCRASSATPERESCLLADVLGYTAEARERATHLPASDAVRLYVSHDDVALERSARDAEASYEARYLFLTRLCHGSSLARWQRFFEHAFKQNTSQADAAMSTELFVSDFHAADIASGAVLASLEGELESRGFQRPGLIVLLIGHGLTDEINEFERVVANPPANLAGTFFDARVLIAHERSLFYSALWAHGDHLLYALSSIDDTKWFSESMGNPVAGPGRDFQERFTHIADAKAGERKSADLEHDLATPSLFGGQLDLAAFDALGPLLTPTSPNASVPIRNFAARLDSRPAAREQLAWVLRSAVPVLTQSEDLFASAARGRGAEDARLLAWQAHLERNPDSLARLLQRADFDTQEWARVLTIAAEDSTVGSGVVDRAFERAVSLHPEDWSLTAAWATRLSEQKNYPRTREIVGRWLGRAHDPGDGFDDLFAHIRIARSFREEGRYAEGLHEIEPFSASYQFGTMREHVLLLAALDRDAEAESLATRALNRYPDGADSRVLRMQTLWKAGRYAEASALLQASPWSVYTADWSSTLPPAFRATFASMPAEAIRAAEALAAGGPGGRLHARRLAEDYEQHGELQTAFEIESRIPSAGAERVLDSIGGYRILKQMKGEAAALAWFKSRVPESLRPMGYLLAWGEGHTELMWTYMPTTTATREDDYEWLLRVTTVALGERDPARVSAANAWLASKGAGSYYVDIARYMLGALSESDLLREMRTPKQRCESYYFLGLKAEAEGRERDAADWLAMSVATGMNHNGELGWSVERLQHWANRERVLRTGRGAPAPVATQNPKRPAGSS